MLFGSMHTADLGARHRELLRLASVAPDTTAILSRYVRDETVVGVVAGVAIAAAAGSWPPFRARAFGGVW